MQSYESDVELRLVFVFAQVRHSKNPGTVLRNENGIIVEHLPIDTGPNMTLVFRKRPKATLPER